MKNVYAGLQRRKNMDSIVVEYNRSRGENGVIQAVFIISWIWCLVKIL